MPEFDFSGSYVNDENVDDDDVIVIIGIPAPEEKTSPTQKVIVNGVLVDKKYMVLNIPVEVDKHPKTYTPDSKTGLRFNESWGKDYSKWPGNKFSVKIEQQKAFGAVKQRVAGYPIKK